MLQGNFSKFIVIFVFLTLGGCSSELLVRQDYESTQKHFRTANYDQALKAFPKKESGGFITTMEKAYLSLLAGQPQLEKLKQHARIIEERVRYDISREVDAFFYVESADGYYASEHEIIWMHLLLSWGYSLEKRYESACVEARKASFLLSAPWSYEGHFDDAMLRVVLGAMWHMCGDWQEARIDFRRAHALEPSLLWAKEIAELEHPPKHLILGLGGTGAEPFWDPSLERNPISGLKRLGFRPEGYGSNLSFSNQFYIPFYTSTDSEAWYERHWVRDNYIHELIKDSQYGLETFARSSIETARASVPTAFYIATGAASAYVGVSLIIEGVGSEAKQLGVIIAYSGLRYARLNLRRVRKEYKENMHDIMDKSESYRYVRFLPSYVWLGWSNKDLEYPIDIQANNRTLLKLSPVSTGVSNTSIFHYPDIY